MKDKKGMEIPNEIWFWVLVGAITLLIILGIASVAEGGFNVKNIINALRS